MTDPTLARLDAHIEARGGDTFAAEFDRVFKLVGEQIDEAFKAVAEQDRGYHAQILEHLRRYGEDDDWGTAWATDLPLDTVKREIAALIAEGRVAEHRQGDVVTYALAPTRTPKGVMKAFSPNGKVAFETCPVCQEPDVRVEYGDEVELVDGEWRETGFAQKLWHCPECGDSVATVIAVEVGEGQCATL